MKLNDDNARDHSLKVTIIIAIACLLGLAMVSSCATTVWG